MQLNMNFPSAIVGLAAMALPQGSMAVSVVPAPTPIAAASGRYGLYCYFPDDYERDSPVLEFEGLEESAAKSISVYRYADFSEDRYDPLDSVTEGAEWPLGSYSGGPLTLTITAKADDSSVSYHDYDGTYEDTGDDLGVGNIECYLFEEFHDDNMGTMTPTVTPFPSWAPPNIEDAEKVALSCWFPDEWDRDGPHLEFEGGVGSDATAISIYSFMDGSENRYEPLTTSPSSEWPMGAYKADTITIEITAKVDTDAADKYHDYDATFLNSADGGTADAMECYIFDNSFADDIYNFTDDLLDDDTDEWMTDDLLNITDDVIEPFEPTGNVGLYCYIGWTDGDAPILEFDGKVGSQATAISLYGFSDGDYTEDRFEPITADTGSAPWPMGTYKAGPITLEITAAAVGADKEEFYHDYDGTYLNTDVGTAAEDVVCYMWELY